MQEIITRDFENCKLFYNLFFEDDAKTETFLNKAYDLTDIDLCPRTMVNLVYRWGSLAADIEKIRPGRDGLKIFFLRSGIEGLCKAASAESGKSSFLSDNMSQDGKDYIRSSFKVIHIEYRDSKHSAKPKDVLGEFEDCFFESRNLVTHEGDYWSTQVFSCSEDDTMWLSDIVLKPGKKDECKVEFETRIRFEEFLRFYIEACVNFINQYIENKFSSNLVI